MFTRYFTALLLAGSVALAQQGDKPGEVQKPLVPKELIPPAPALTPEQALKTFKLKPGFRIELVASEPLVHEPVAMTFDADGRLWVLEMRGFMPNVDGKGEDAKVASVAVLEDTDGDGKMDKRTEFLSGLVMPRALSLVGDGLLVAEPPMLWYWRDTNGDGKADEKTEVAKDYAAQADTKLGTRANPEHASNGLMWGMDNWIYSANHGTRFRFVRGEWQRSPTSVRGQWGISQDDAGRIVYNSNSDQLRIDYVPSQYFTRNPFYRSSPGLNVDPVKNQKTWPARVTPGINRGYQPPMLRDGRLATFTAACGPVIYRGDNFPPEYRGNAFVCEPAGNLVKRNILVDKDGIVSGQQAYEKDEFLASTDERFRPVNAFNGPDGALYIVDLYRGIVQHRVFVTSYLRQQILDRGLENPTGLGRIYRIVSTAKALGPKPSLGKASPEELVKQLSNPNGWWRDTAQRLLVERAPAAAVEPLRQLARKGADPLGRLHALWTLDGINQLDIGTLKAALNDANPKVQVAAVRLSENALKSEDMLEVLNPLLAMAGKASPEVQWQLAFTFGETREKSAEAAILQIARQNPTNEYIRGAVLSSLVGRELEALEQLLADKALKDKPGGIEKLVAGLCQCIMTQPRTPSAGRVLEVIGASATPQWQRLALLDGIIATLPAGGKTKSIVKPKPIRLPGEPPAWAVLNNTQDKAVRDRFSKIASIIVWPGKPGAEPEPVVKPLTPEQQARYDLGKSLYEVSCAACHQPHGLGQEGLAPPLLDSEWVAGTDQRLVRIVLHGLRGQISVKGRKYELDMPALGVFEDDQIAGILTYVRREWGHTYDPVEPQTVKTIRAATASRQDAWSEAELQKVK